MLVEGYLRKHILEAYMWKRIRGRMFVEECSRKNVRRRMFAEECSRKHICGKMLLSFGEFIFCIDNAKWFRLPACRSFLFHRGLHPNLLGLQTASNELRQKLPNIFLHRDKVSAHLKNSDNAPSGNDGHALKNYIIHLS